MTGIVEVAIEKLRKLPLEKRELYATSLVEEIDADQKWDQLFAATTDEQWDKMTREASNELHRGHAIRLGDFLSTS